MSILIERQRNRIHLFSPYRDYIVEHCREIPGSGRTKFKDGRHRSWTFPLDWHTCLELRQRFGDELEIGPKLALWARVERRRQRAGRRLLRAAGADLARVAAVSPSLAAAMAARTYQQVGVAYAARSGASLNADEPGLGKTLQAMGAVIESEVKGPILVLAPQSALEITWEEELTRWLPEDAAYALVGDRKKRSRLLEEALTCPTERTWVLANYEMLRIHGSPIRDKTEGRIVGYQPAAWPEILEALWSAVVVDECQRLLITRTPVLANQSLQRQGAMALEVEKLKLALSGTPDKSRTENLWGTLNWLAPHKYPSFNRWIDRYFEIYDNAATGERILVGVHPAKEKAFYEEIDSYMIRRTKREVAPDMPPKVYAGWHLNPDDEASPVGVWLEMTPEQRRAYAEMKEQAISALDEGELYANGVLAELTRLKQFSDSYAALNDDSVTMRMPSNKINWLVPWLAERGIERGGDRKGHKIIIASQFAKFVNLMEYELNKLGIKTLKITGENKKDRKTNAQAFQDPNSGYRVMLLSTTAGGVSLTLDLAKECVIMDETWSPDDQTQVEDRGDRISRPNDQLTCWYVRSLGTIEEAIAADNESLGVVSHHLLDGRRGVRRARELLDYRSTRKLKVKS